jgi:hypothetical protein
MDMGGLGLIVTALGVAPVSLMFAIVGARHGSANVERMAWACGCFVGVGAAVSAAWVAVQAESPRGFLAAPPLVGAFVSYIMARRVAVGSKPHGQ